MKEGWFFCLCPERKGFLFTGIIRTVSKVKKTVRQGDSLLLTIEKPKGWQTKAGDSIATDGACLTISKVGREDYTVSLMPETLNKTYFGKQVPEYVNLEPSLKLSDLLSGHLVLGHVDSVGIINQIIKHGSSRVCRISFPSGYAKLVAPKGSIAVDGISLTVVGASKNWFSVSLVDYTLKHTTLGQKKVGDFVNLEFDIIAKYINAKS